MQTERAFTLVETLVASGILALVAAGTVAASLGAARVAAAPHERDRLLVAARNV